MAELAAVEKTQSQSITEYHTPEDTLVPEIVIALCAPIGTQVHKVSSVLKNLIETQFQYDCQEIRLSRIIEELSEKSFKNKPESERLKGLINTGDELREKLGPSVLAEKAIEKINEIRMAKRKEKGSFLPGERIAYIIDSIKNQAEMDLLKFIYRDECYVVGAFSSKEQRIEELKNKKMSDSDANILIELDAGEHTPEEQKRYSQTVKRTFAQSDLFLRMGTKANDELEAKLGRFLHLIFASKMVTPTEDEAAMFAAAAAASNSGCLSRQVGACVTNAKGEILATGWNDVPAPGGGLYRCTDKSDMRCAGIEDGECYNTKYKTEIIDEICKELIEQKCASNRDLAKRILEKSRISSLIEFSRAIHAEMHAIIQVGKNGCGQEMEGGRLFCTTYPCHACARHIVAAGIKKIYYIEPYSKSLATRLHDDSLTEAVGNDDKVQLLAFDGVAPNRFLDFFTQSSRKDNPVVPFKKRVPKTQMTIEAIPVLEGLVVKNLKKKMEKENEGKPTVLQFPTGK